MIPLPRARLLTSAMLVGTAVGMVAAVAASVLVKIHARPDAVIGLVLGVPTVIGLLMVLVSGRRWVTMLGALLLALAPGWFGMLVAIQAVSGA